MKKGSQVKVGKMTREELFDLVWSRPVSKIAKEMGISDVALAKQCRRKAIPLPPRGYWARVDAGQVPPRPTLPELPQRTPKKQTSVAPRFEKLQLARRRFKARFGRKDQLEIFYSSIDSFQRHYSLGISMDQNDPAVRETETLEVTSTIRGHADHAFRHIRTFLFSDPRQGVSPDLECRCIGAANIEKDSEGRRSLSCVARIPQASFHSICQALGQGTYVEVMVRTCNMKRGHGQLIEVAFNSEPTALPAEHSSPENKSL